MKRNLTMLFVAALTLLTGSANRALGAASCWYEPGDPPIEHCDAPPECGDVAGSYIVEDFSDSSSIARVTTFCSLSGARLSCSRTISPTGCTSCLAAQSDHLPC